MITYNVLRLNVFIMRENHGTEGGITPSDQLPAIIQPGALTPRPDTHLVPALIAAAGEQAGWRYVETERRIFLTYDRGPGRARLALRPENPHARAYLQLQEDVAADMQFRAIRAYHYTRLIDSEVEAMRRDGIHLSTPATLRSRLDTCVAEGLLMPAEADALFEASPLHRQMTIRADRFWLTSHPHVVDDSGVSSLLKHWGGEVTYMWVQDETLIAKVQAIGKPRIIEAAVPLNHTTASYNASKSVLATFARSLGCVTSKHAIDVCATAALPSDATSRSTRMGSTPSPLWDGAIPQDSSTWT